VIRERGRVVYTSAVSRFLGGFVTATLIWGAAFAAYVSGVFTPDEPEPVAEVALEPDAGVADEEPTTGRRRRGRRGGRRGGPDAPAYEPSPQGNALTGDDLGDIDRLNLDVESEGGEEQLSSAEIQQGMDGVFNRVRRCLVLAAGDDPVSGRLTFGLRIEPNGTVSRVNLSGPRAVTTGDAGSCLRDAARGARFPSFDGPPMIARYPLTLD
jgi:hypothetical protein